MQRRHIDRINVGPLLAIDLDRDEEAVHHLRDFLVLETLMRHHVAPVAGGIADRKQDRLSFPPRCVERFLAPGPPMDGVVLVLEEIGARLLAQEIA